MDFQDKYMQRCIQLAALGAGYTAPNPMVGAVLVYQDQVIGEGYHRHYGEAHAEVNCVRAVPAAWKPLISQATLYVSLEPCAHYGHTPPCTDLILDHKIPRVVIGCIDPSAKVGGKGVARLREAGVEVMVGIEEAACKRLNKRFFCFQQCRRPYVILKWARSADGYIALPGPRRVKISHPYTDRLVHRWRSEEAALLIGAGTALTDDPSLTNRWWTGNNPVRIVLDREARLPLTLHVFDGKAPTLVFNGLLDENRGVGEWIAIPPAKPFLNGIMEVLYQRDLLSVMVEGGAGILQSFIEADLWDEARVITSNSELEEGLSAPVLKQYVLMRQDQVERDTIRVYENAHERTYL